MVITMIIHARIIKQYDPRYGNYDTVNTRVGSTYLQLYDATIARHLELERMGYEVKFVWEIDWRAGQTFSERHPERWPDLAT